MAGPLRMFRFVHGAIRAELAAVEAAAFSLDAADDRGAAALLARVADFERFLREHEDVEESVIFPALDAPLPHVAQAYRLDHRAGEATTTALRAHLRVLASDTPVPERDRALHGAQREAVALAATVSLHAAKEDEHLFPLADDAVSLAEQQVLVGQAVARVGPEQTQRNTVWTFERLDPEGRDDFLRTYQGMMPPPVFGGILGLLAEHLPAPEWAAVLRRHPGLAPASSPAG